MKIAYYMPFKPMGHSNPSGDLVTGTEIYCFLKNQGHSMTLASRLRCRWIYYRPWALCRLLSERNRLNRFLATTRPDLWLTYHSYYKAPDLLGPICARRSRLPYVIFQGIYSTKRRRRIKTLPGFLLNRRTLRAATHVFTNKKRDFANLERLLPADRLSYIAPGIHPDHFTYDEAARHRLRDHWGAQHQVVIMSAAMMRPGVKSEGLATVITTCGQLNEAGLDVKLIIAGDGPQKAVLQKLAGDKLGNQAIFLGRISREQMKHYYSAADIFAFPGRHESLGMVYLEAQACGLPVVAFGDWGGGEAVRHGSTGLLASADKPDEFVQYLDHLVTRPALRKEMAANAISHVRRHHDLTTNYTELEQKLLQIVDQAGQPHPQP